MRNSIYLLSNVLSPTPVPPHKYGPSSRCASVLAAEPGTGATHNEHADGCFPGSQTREQAKLDRKGHAGQEQACPGPGDFPGLRHAAPRLGGSAAGEPATPFPAKGTARVPRVQSPPQGDKGLRWAGGGGTEGAQAPGHSASDLGVLICKMGC